MGRRKRKNDLFNSSAWMNNATWNYYFYKLFNIGVSMFEWKNLPETIDPIFMERVLFNQGKVLFFKDDVIGFVALRSANGGKINIYDIPTERRAIAPGYISPPLNEKNSVIIYNDYMRLPSRPDCEMFAYKLWDIDRTLSVNMRAQKTPILIICDESERLTMQNLYMQYDGNMPVIMASKQLNPDAFKVLKTDAPFYGKELYDIKTETWNEALTHLGIPNVAIRKKERLNTDEVNRNMGGVIASRYTRLDVRKYACEQINKMFDLNIDVEIKGDFIENENDGNNEEMEDFNNE